MKKRYGGLTGRQWFFYLITMPVALPMFITGFFVGYVKGSFGSGLETAEGLHEWIKERN